MLFSFEIRQHENRFYSNGVLVKLPFNLNAFKLRIYKRHPCSIATSSRIENRVHFFFLCCNLIHSVVGSKKKCCIQKFGENPHLNIDQKCQWCVYIVIMYCQSVVSAVWLLLTSREKESICIKPGIVCVETNGSQSISKIYSHCACEGDHQRDHPGNATARASPSLFYTHAQSWMWEIEAVKLHHLTAINWFSMHR